MDQDPTIDRDIAAAIAARCHPDGLHAMLTGDPQMLAALIVMTTPSLGHIRPSRVAYRVREWQIRQTSPKHVPFCDIVGKIVHATVWLDDVGMLFQWFDEGRSFCALDFCVNKDGDTTMDDMQVDTISLNVLMMAGMVSEEEYRSYYSLYQIESEKQGREHRRKELLRLTRIIIQEEQDDAAEDERMRLSVENPDAALHSEADS